MDAEALALEASPRGPRTLTVSELTQEIRFLLAASGVLRGVAVRGEVSDLHQGQGPLRFRLRDEGAVVDCIMFRTWLADLVFEVRNGQEVLCYGDVDVYPPKGTYQLVVRGMEPWGIGAQHLALVQLRERLQREGLFSAEVKRPLPPFPSVMGIVTSEGSAALQDILSVLRRRWPMVRIVLASTPVQGPQAAHSMVQAIGLLGPQVEMVVLARGGGSEGDLGAYNDEGLVRAVRACPVPVVSAVGHEVDSTLVDLAADLRAPTPSAAAEMLTPDAADLKATLLELLDDLHHGARGYQGDLAADLAQLRERTLPLLLRDRLPLERSAMAQQHRILLHTMEAHSALLGERLEAQGQLLDRVNPRAILDRGYALVRRWATGQPVQSTEEVAPGDLVGVEMRDGGILCQVLEVRRTD